MITVLHLITGLYTGGAEMMLYKLIARSDRTRFRHVVISLMDGGPVGDKIRALGVPVYTLGMRRGAPNVAGAFRFLALLRRNSPDILQTWLYHADLLGLLSLLVTRAPIVWNIQCSFHHGLKSTTSKLCARLSRLPAAVVVNSEAGREVHTQIGYHPREWMLIPNGFDVQEFVPDAAARESVRRELALPSDTVLVGLIARFDPLKDHPNFLQAASILSQQRPDVHFLLVGRDVTFENDTLRRLVEDGGLVDKAHLLGERQDIPRLTSALDIAALSSYAEGFPGVVVEAMACEVPCVVTEAGDAARIVGNTGRAVPPKDPHAFASALQELVDIGDQGRLALGRRARRRIEDLCALERTVWQYEELYKRLAS